MVDAGIRYSNDPVELLAVFGDNNGAGGYYAALVAIPTRIKNVAQETACPLL